MQAARDVHDDRLHRTSARLADGRELLYYDDAPGHDRADAVDGRPLPPSQTTSELRRDPLTGAEVVIAGHRQTRTYKPPADLCPLCPTQPGRPTEIPAAEYDVVVFENRFPSLSMAAEAPAEVGGLAAVRAGRGRCDVVVFASDHDGSLAGASRRRLRTVIDALADRTAVLSQQAGIEQVFPFENRGEDIGVTLHHPHGQIYAYPFVTPRTRRKLEAARRHRDGTGRSLFADVLDAELADGRRIIVAGRRWVAYTPAAARWPYELLLIPRRHVADLADLDAEERAELAEILPVLLGGFERLFDGPGSYIAGWQQAPVNEGRDEFRLHLELFTMRRSSDKLKYLAGSESGAGVWINDILPEQAAERLREVCR